MSTIRPIVIWLIIIASITKRTITTSTIPTKLAGAHRLRELAPGRKRLRVSIPKAVRVRAIGSDAGADRHHRFDRHSGKVRHSSRNACCISAARSSVVLAVPAVQMSEFTST
jgi:hypothetical protein